MQAAQVTSLQMNQFATDIVKAQDLLVGMGLDVECARMAMAYIAQAATATSLGDLSKAGFSAMSNFRAGRRSRGSGAASGRFGISAAPLPFGV